MLDRAEVALHHMFGDATYWVVRRSMRFAKPLVQTATDFRKQWLDSTDKQDNTVRPSNWLMEKQVCKFFFLNILIL